MLKEHKTEFAMAVRPTKTAYEAVAEGNLFALSKLYKASAVRETARDPRTGRSILSEAVLKGDAFMAEFLVENGASVTLRSNLGAETALHFAVLGGNVECMDILLVHGAEPNARNKAGQTPLHLANAVDIAHFLISSSCRDDVEDNWKRTPYTVAAQEGNTKLARFLSNRLLEQKKREQARTKALRQRRADKERQKIADEQRRRREAKSKVAKSKLDRVKEDYMAWRKPVAPGESASTARRPPRLLDGGSTVRSLPNR